MLMAQNFRVTAQWDDEAGVWVATSDDIVGLVTEAPTLDALFERVVAVAPELLADNGVPIDGRGTVDIHIVSDLRAAE
jgi:predicted RNase H-like HicB family nuclease